MGGRRGGYQIAVGAPSSRVLQMSPVTENYRPTQPSAPPVPWERGLNDLPVFALTWAPSRLLVHPATVPRWTENADWGILSAAAAGAMGSPHFITAHTYMKACTTLLSPSGGESNMFPREMSGK